MKPRSDSPLKNLPEDLQQQIVDWCNVPKSESGPDGRKTPGGYKHAKAQLASDGIKVSEGALSEFYSWWHLRQDFRRTDSLTHDFEELLKKEFPSADPQKIQDFGQTFFTLQAAAKRDAQEFRDMEYLRLSKETAATKGRQEEKKLELAERRVRLLEENASKAKEKLETVIKKSSGVISKETLETLEQAAKLL